MDDRKITELFFERSERAIEECTNKYGRYIRSVAYSVLASECDAEEVENDTYLRAWNAIPPQRPAKLGAFLAKIARNLALDRYEVCRRDRINLAAETVLDELSECLPDEGGISVTDEVVLRSAVNSFLESLDSKTRVVFMRRYWYMLPIKEIARLGGIGESSVKVILHRTRKRFKEHLQKEGINI